jgi:hypothetical protein
MLREPSSNQLGPGLLLTRIGEPSAHTHSVFSQRALSRFLGSYQTGVNLIRRRSRHCDASIIIYISDHRVSHPPTQMFPRRVNLITAISQLKSPFDSA